MNFTFQPQTAANDRASEGPAFTLNRLWRRQQGRETEITHLMDRSYPYQSVRELQWYLAEKFGLPVAALDVEAAA